MRSDEPISRGDTKPSYFNWELYYYERVGSRYYLRITPFALILIFLALLIGFTILILDSKKHPTQEINTNITVPSASPYSPQNTIIRQASPMPRVRKQPKAALPSPPAPPSLNQNSNER